MNLRYWWWLRFPDLRDWWSCPDFLQDEQFVDQQNWYSEVRDAEIDHALLLDYAREKFRTVSAIGDALDKKAEWIFTVAGALSTALYAVTKAQTNPWWALLPFSAFLFAMVLSVRARSPLGAPIPTTVRGLIEECPGDDARVRLAASHHLAAEGQKLIDAWKARQIVRASWCIVAGVALMVFVVLFGS